MSHKRNFKLLHTGFGVCLCLQVPLQTPPIIDVALVDCLSTPEHTLPAHAIWCAARGCEANADMYDIVPPPLHLRSPLASYRSCWRYMKTCETQTAWFHPRSWSFPDKKRVFARLRVQQWHLWLPNWCHLAQTSPKELGVFRNVTMTAGLFN